MHRVARHACLGLSAILIASTATLTKAADFPCFEDAAIQSARIHDLRTMLMVNALKCRTRNPDTLRSYGNLLDQRGGELADHSKLVLLNLQQRYGEAQGLAAYHRYETAIANYHSLPAPSQAQCDEIGTYIALATRADHGEWETLSRLVTSRSIDVCLTPAAGAAAPLARGSVAGAMGAAMGAPTRGAAPETEVPLVDGIPTYSVPGTGPETAPEPLERVALPAAGSAPASAAPSAEKKLDQAILALSAAVAALSELRQQP